ncbi:exported hypothetical protein [Desulfosarcina cetonica]|uniref:hypothetical protein n=1 Tax=Desulfosarcina cetonica TaxID=90730 RepID=UPI0006D0AD00|nr:hypothetical protein [Desulfosarcina cetonica]VTR66412.1 exported hypothetical protein [Desulfosarcina cetonica]
MKAFYSGFRWMIVLCALTLTMTSIAWADGYRNRHHKAYYAPRPKKHHHHYYAPAPPPPVGYYTYLPAPPPPQPARVYVPVVPAVPVVPVVPVYPGGSHVSATVGVPGFAFGFSIDR